MAVNPHLNALSQGNWRATVFWLTLQAARRCSQHQPAGGATTTVSTDDNDGDEAEDAEVTAAFMDRPKPLRQLQSIFLYRWVSCIGYSVVVCSFRAAATASQSPSDRHFLHFTTVLMAFTNHNVLILFAVPRLLIFPLSRCALLQPLVPLQRRHVVIRASTEGSD